MQFITTDQRIAVENFEVGVVYTVAFTSGDSFTGSCMGIGVDFVAFQRTAPEYIFCLTMTTAADVASIEPLPADIGQILEYTGSVPVSIKTDGTPLLDYLITGNTTQSGTPTPDNPIMPQGTGERTAQLWDEEYLNGYYNSSNTFISANNQICSKSKIAVKPNTAYWLGVYSTSTTAFLGVLKYNENAEFIERVNTEAYKGDGVVFTTDASTYYININFGAYYGSVYNDDIIIAESSTPLPYEPYGYKIPISSATTTTPVYLGEMETTRNIKKYEFTGEESIGVESAYSRFYFTLNNSLIIGARKTPAFCTHWQVIDDGRAIADVPNNALYSDSGNSRWFIKTTDYTTADDFKAYLAAQYSAGTPLTVWYVLANPETAVVNEPLMCIGVYADTLSYRQSGVNIPTTDGLNIFDIDTTVKPSEVYLKYFSPLF